MSASLENDLNEGMVHRLDCPDDDVEERPLANFNLMNPPMMSYTGLMMQQP